MKLNYIIIYILFLVSSLVVLSQSNYPTIASEAQLVFEDVDLFIDAFNSLSETSDTTHVMDDKYLKQGTDGLKEYISRHGLSAEMLAKAISENPEDYRKLSTEFPDIKNKYLKMYKKELAAYKKVVPDAMFPPTYFLVGANRGIAQASRPGQLVTIERSWDNPDRKFATIIHELTHFQQARTLGFGEYASMYRKENNMLDIILREGGAEFITYYLVRKNTKKYARLQYVNENESELKARFKKDLANQDQSFWLWDSIDQDEVPILLGYTMGYKICKAYYDTAENKEQAIKDILGVTNPEEFLKKSRYLE